MPIQVAQQQQELTTFLFLWFGLIWWVLVALNLQNKKNWSPLHSTVAVAAMAHRPPWSRISLVWNIFYFSILGIVTPTAYVSRWLKPPTRWG
jgi:hypothetical protein